MSDSKLNRHSAAGDTADKKRSGSSAHVLSFLVCLLTAGIMVMCACGLGAGINASDSLPSVVVGIDQFEPYSYINSRGEYEGIDVELAREAFDRLGYKPVFKQINWADKDEYLKNGDIDCIWSCYSMTDREDKYAWAGPYMYSRQVVVVRNDSDIYTLQDLEGKRIGVQATTKAAELFLHKIDSPLPEAKQVVCLSTTAEMYAVLRKDYVDAVSGHEAMLKELTSFGSGSSYRMLDESPYMTRIGVAFRKGTHAMTVSELNNALAAMLEDGTIEAVASKYGIDPITVRGGYEQK